MNELLHRFKLGNDAELLLEKRGGGFEKVATVPIGSQALGATTSSGEVIKIRVGKVSAPLVIDFPDFAPSTLASLSSGTTASQSGTTVTVICGGASPAPHNIPASRAGTRFYYSGSPSIAAGWYTGLAVVDANTLSFQRATAAVASESVYSGAAFTALAVCCQIDATADFLGNFGDYGLIEILFHRTGDTSAGSKTFRTALNGSTVYQDAKTTTPTMTGGQSFVGVGPNKQISTWGQDGTAAAGGQNVHTIDTSGTARFDIRLQVSAAQMWMGLDMAKLRVS